MKSSKTNREYPVQVICATHNDPDLSFGCSCCHEEVEILFVHSGQILLKTEDTSVILESGQGILINRNIPHTVLPAKQGTFSLYCLLFDPAFLFDDRQPDLADKYLAPILDNPDIRTLSLTESSDSSCGLLSAARDIIACNLSGTFGRELYTKGRLCLFWHHLLSHFLSSSGTAKGWRIPCATKGGVRIRQAVRFIAQNYAEPITLDDIAFSIHVSRSECCRCFKRTLGLTPFEYLQKYRIYLSTLKLQAISDTPFTIAQLAASVGFNNASYYNKLFRKYLRCTPTEYRKKAAEASVLSENNPSSDGQFFHPLL